MSDVHKSGPLGGDGESRPLTVDLTRLDIRRGMLYLPRRFHDAFPEGAVEAEDAVAGDKLTLRFTPPRQLEGLGPFFEAHELRPNDGVSLFLSATGLRLTPIRRERRSPPPSGAYSPQQRSVQEESAYPEVPEVQRATVSERRAGGWRSVLHESAAGSERREAQPERRQQDGGSVPTSRGDQRAKGPANSGAAEEGRSRRDADRRPPDARPSPEASPAQRDRMAFDAGGAEPWHLAPRDLSTLFPRPADPATVSRPSPERKTPSVDSPRSDSRGKSDSDSGQGLRGPKREEESQWIREVRRAAPEPVEPLAAEFDGSQRGLFEEPAPRQDQPATTERNDARLEQAPPAPSPEPVAVGTGRASSAVTVAEYLRDPGTPAIVRAGAVAETLGLPVDEVREAMAKAAGQSDGKITPIRPDVYLVKRG